MKGGDLTLGRTIGICRIDKMTQLQMKVMSGDKEVAAVNRKHGESRKNSNQRGLNGTSNVQRNHIKDQIKM